MARKSCPRPIWGVYADLFPSGAYTRPILRGVLRDAAYQLARWLLAETDLPQSQIAARCGFSSTPFFSTSFRRMTGSRPGEYRKAARAG